MGQRWFFSQIIVSLLWWTEFFARRYWKHIVSLFLYGMQCLVLPAWVSTCSWVEVVRVKIDYCSCRGYQSLQDGWASLSVAAQNGHLEMLRLLLEQKADITHANKVVHHRIHPHRRIHQQRFSTDYATLNYVSFLKIILLHSFLTFFLQIIHLNLRDSIHFP